MHIHILGICGTFMGGLAVLAREAGHTVTGCDTSVYEPMKSQLEKVNIVLTEGYDAEQINLKPDLFVIGNVVSRGNPLIEAILNKNLPFTSGPQWLAEEILAGKKVLAVAGTHGKTSTASILVFLLENLVKKNGKKPGFLIGGIPLNYDISARLGDSEFFVIEADEYDTAFFDKRSKFIHYRPYAVILNNLEYDHADIFPNLQAIQTQFHHLIRTVPSEGHLIVNSHSKELAEVLKQGCWSLISYFGNKEGWHAQLKEFDRSNRNEQFDVFYKENLMGTIHWSLYGEHNRMNALAAIALIHAIGYLADKKEFKAEFALLSDFKGIKRRMEIKGCINGVTVYDDFAHHPTAIETTIAGLKRFLKGDGRILVVFEARSNTMRTGMMKSLLAKSLAEADLIFAYSHFSSDKSQLAWDMAQTLAPLGERAGVFHEIEDLISEILKEAKSNDHVLIMSNGGFENIHEKLLNLLSMQGK